MRKILSLIAVACLLIVCTYFAIDILNIPTVLGINVASINWDIAGIVIGNVIVVALFYITYHLLDKRNILKENNQREIAVLTLHITYDTCSEMIEFFDKKMAVESASKHCNGDKLEFQDPVLQQYLNIPFVHEASIVDFAKSGVISADEYRAYLSVNQKYKSHIRIRLIFPDVEELGNSQKATAVEAIKAAKNALPEIKKVGK